jgi:deoxyhypusine synthase
MPQIVIRGVGRLNIPPAITYIEFVLDLRVQVMPSRKRPGLVSFISSLQNDLSQLAKGSLLVTILHKVNHVDPTQIKNISEYLKAMDKVGVLGAGRLGRATEIVKRMFDDKDCFTFLAMSGPMIPGGLRNIVRHLVENGQIQAIVTSGANIVHDLVEAYGGSHFRVPPSKDDAELREAGMGRIADIFVHEKDFVVFEKGIYKFLDSLPTEKMTTLAPSEFLTELGRTIKDNDSIVKQAVIHNVPIFSPGLMDSMLGFHLYTYSTTKNLALDFVKDLRILGDIVTKQKKTGAIILGGGLTKHFTMGSTILRGGLDMAIQITLDRPEGGSLGGAPLVEGISWQKMQKESNFETVIGDATILFPLLVTGVDI